MSTGNFCVAGWDVNQLRMVRPLPGGRNWTAALLAQYAVVPGALIEFSPTGVAHNSSYPHLTEDTQVDIMATITLNAPLQIGLDKMHHRQAPQLQLRFTTT